MVKISNSFDIIKDFVGFYWIYPPPTGLLVDTICNNSYIFVIKLVFMILYIYFYLTI